MEPRIQYAKTSDNVSIAFWTLGEGEPLVAAHAFPWTNIELEWRLPAYRAFYERLAERIRLIRFDARGCGCSQRDVSDFSLPAFMLDIDAVADRLQLDRFALWAYGNACPVAIRYAVRNPRRVSRLILIGPYASASEMSELPASRAAQALRESGTDWNILSETLTRIVFGLDMNDAEVRAWAAMLQQCVNQEQALAILRATDRFDVTDDLEHVQTSTLVLPNPFSPWWPPPEMVRAIASGIPDARFTSLSRTPGVASAFDDLAAVQPWATVITDFATEGEGSPSTQLPSGMTAILFADIAESTALTERLGDSAFRAKARELDTALRGVIRENSGTPVEGKLLGDGVLATFSSASQAIEAALRCGRAGDEAELPLHIGLHAGDVIREDNNVYGGAVNIAARIAALSAPGELLVSDTLRGLARTSAGVSFEDRGENELKGVSEPVRVYEVRWREDV